MSKVLIASAHGCIQCNLGMYNTISVPDGMELVKISVSAAGKRCIFNTFLVNKYIDMINFFNPLLSNRATTNEYLINIIKNIILNMKQGQKALLDHSIKNQIFKIGIDEEGEYLGTNGFKIYNLTSGQIIANKTYRRHFRDKRGNDYSIVELDSPNREEPLQINGKNVVEHVGELKDLLSVMHKSTSNDAPRPNDIQQITLSQILNYYKTNGVTKIILFDLACSSYLDDENSCCDENVSQNISNTNYDIPYGGKMNAKTKRNKHKRNKRKRNKSKRNKSKRK